MQEDNDGVRLERSRMPLSLQIGILLRKRLEDKDWQVGEQLPTLEQFMVEYGVSRATMRAALADLEGEGLIERGRGRGTFVTGDVTEERWLMLPTEWRALVEHVERLHARIVTLESGSGRPQVAPAEGTLCDKYWRVKRVNWTEKVPYSLTTLYLADEIHRKHARKFDGQPILPLLARLYAGELAEASQVLLITLADVETAHHLRLSVGAPIANVRRILRDHRGRILYLAEVEYPAKHLRIETHMRPDD